MQQAYTRWAFGYVVFGCIAVPVYLLSGDLTRAVLSVISVVLLLPAAWVGWRVHRLPNGFMLTLSAIGLLYVVSGVLDETLDSDVVGYATTPLELAANLLIIAALGFVSVRRRGRFSGGDILDGIIIALGGWLIAWITLVQPSLELDERPPLGLVANMLYLPMTAPVIALTAVLIFSSTRRRPATWLLAAGALMNIAGDTIYALFEVGHAGLSAQHLANALYLPAFAWSGAAYLHPTAVDLVTAPPDSRRLKLPGRLTLTFLSLTVPILVMVVLPSTSTVDRLTRALTALCILTLVSLRLAGATRSHLESQERLIVAGRTDVLTSLPNRVAMLEMTQDALEASWKKQRPVSVFLIDIDRFKNTNDSLGHGAGDQALRIVAQRLLDVATRLGVSIGRPSGDEFLVLDTTAENAREAAQHAEAFHDTFATPVSLDAGVMFLTSSVGIATMPTNRSIDAADIFRHADIAMYRAKDAGRNRLATYDDSMQQRVTERMAIETALHSALDRRELRLYHQPIVDTASGRVCGFEALMRWQRTDGTMMSPIEFIPIAEESGIITSLGAWALLEALTQLRRWIDDDVVAATTTVSVNASARQICDPGFCDVVGEALTRAGLPAQLLWLEVTETMMIDNPALARQTLQGLRELGVRIALDDFGTGYSSLSLLQQFPIQSIKIDRTFVSGITESQQDRSLVRTIIAMGNSLGLDIVGEGVETVQQLKMLRKLGCNKVQGYLISHPVPPEAMSSTIAALESLSQWEAFDDVLGDRPDRPTRIR